MGCYFGSPRMVDSLQDICDTSEYDECRRSAGGSGKFGSPASSLSSADANSSNDLAVMVKTSHSATPTEDVALASLREAISSPSATACPLRLSSVSLPSAAVGLARGNDARNAAHLAAVA